MSGRVRQHAGARSDSFEALEARTVLSGDYYTHLSLDEIAGSDQEWYPLTGISADGQYAWGWNRGDEESFIATRERIWRSADLPLLDHSDIRDVTGSGEIFAYDIFDGRYFLLDLHDPVERRYFDELEFEVDPLIRYQLVPSRYLDNGDFLLTLGGEGYTELWVLSGGVAHALWRHDHTDSGELLAGTSATGIIVGNASVGDDVVPVMWSGPTGLIELRGLRSVEDVNRHGLAAGKTADGHVGYWDNGQVSVTEVVEVGDWSTGSLYSVLQIDDRGRLLLRHDDVVYKFSHQTEILLLDGAEPSSIWTRVFDRHDEVAYMDGVQPEYMLSEDGDLAYNGYLQPVPAEELLPSIPGYSMALGAQGDLATVVTVGHERWQLLMLADAGGVRDWTLAREPLSRSEFWEAPDLEFATYRDPRSGGVIIAMADPDADLSEYPTPDQQGAPYLIAADPNRGPTTRWDFYPRIQRALTAFVSFDHRVHFAGLDEGGDLILYYDWRVEGEWRATYQNMTEAHLAPCGLATPDFTGQLASFSTDWGGMNIVGLDSSGEVRALWWSFSSHGWQLANLSHLTDAPRLVGPITATATPWGAMQIFGADARGHLIGLWWSPTSNGWHAADLTVHTAGLALDASRLTVQMLPWNGMSLFGKSEGGEIVTYWWTPHTGWTSESLTEELGQAAPVIPGPVSFQTTPSGSQHIAGVSDEGQVMHLYWLPDGQGWRVQDLTQLAIG